MRKQILNEEFRRMQKLAGIITEAKTDVEKKQRLEALVDFFSQSGTGDEMRAIRNTYLHFKNNKDIETLEPVLKNRYLKSPGIFNFEGFTEDEFKEIVEKLAEIKDDESFLEAPSFNENEIKRRLKEAEESIANFLNANIKEFKRKVANPRSKFEIIGDEKVATAGPDSESGIDVSFDKAHMLELFPAGDPFNKVEETEIAGRKIYYNNYL